MKMETRTLYLRCCLYNSSFYVCNPCLSFFLQFASNANKYEANVHSGFSLRVLVPAPVGSSLEDVVFG